MKKLRIFPLLTLVLTLTLVLAGCGTIDALEDKIDHRLDVVEDKIEEALLPGNAKKTVQDSPRQRSGATDATEELTAAQAKEIALAHAGVGEADVALLQAHYEMDDGRPEYEVSFYVDSVEYDYTIHAETGDILEFDRDREGRRG